MRETLLNMLEPVVAALGYELVELEFLPQGRGGLLRLYIDHQPEAVTLDDCERVSRQVSSVLDVEDPVPGAYSLEVSSPGLDRPLRKLGDFQRFAGRRAKVELTLPLNGRRRFTGILTGVEADEILMEVDGESFRLPVQQIGKAHLVPEF